MRVHRLDGADPEERGDRGGRGGGFQGGAVRVGILGARLGSRRGRVQEGTLVLAFREEHDSGLRARDHREERGDASVSIVDRTIVEAIAVRRRGTL